MENLSLYKTLGLTEKQILVYDHLLNHGPHTVAKLSEETKLQRGVVFFLLKELIDKGIVEKGVDTKGKQAYVSTHPENLLKLIEKKETDVLNTKKQLELELPALITNFNLTTSKPGVVYFEGPEQFQRVYEDILRVGKEYKDLYSSFDFYLKYTEEAKKSNFFELKQKTNIKARILYKFTEDRIKLYFKKTVQEDIRFVEDQVLNLPSEILIYGTKVVLISFNPSLLATVIDNPDINQTFNQIFDYIWDTTKPYHDQVVTDYLKDHPELKK